MVFQNNGHPMYLGPFDQHPNVKHASIFFSVELLERELRPQMRHVGAPVFHHDAVDVGQIGRPASGSDRNFGGPLELDVP